MSRLDPEKICNAEWVWRRREYSGIDYKVWASLGDRGLKEGTLNSSTGQPIEVKIVRHFSPVNRDEKLSLYKFEPGIIDSTLEIVNATTDLIEG